MSSVHWSVRTLVTAVACGLGFAGAVTVPTGALALAQPVLVVEPAEGQPGAQVTADASGFGACQSPPVVDVAPRVDAAPPGEVVFTWDGKRIAGPTSVVRGAAAASFTVPENASPGTHTVEAVCAGDRSLASSAEFAVTDVERRALALDPEDGPPGSEVHATATGFVGCPPSGQDDVGQGEVVFLWDGQRVAGPVELDRGVASASFVVPGSEPAGVHQVVARCVGEPEREVSEGFTVSPVATAGSGDPGGQFTPPATVGPSDPRADVGPVWPALVLLLVAGLLTAWAVRARRDLRWVRLHVRVAAGPAPLDAAVPVESYPPSVAVRVEPRPDSGSHVLQEVHR